MAHVDNQFDIASQATSTWLVCEDRLVVGWVVLLYARCLDGIAEDRFVGKIHGISNCLDRGRCDTV